MTGLKRPRVQVIGCGYVGLTTALAFASRGIAVTGIETDLKKRELISSGRLPFHEPGLEELLRKLLGNNFEVRDSQVESDVSFMSVGTPSKNDGGIELAFVESACQTLGELLKNLGGYHTVVVKSTVLPGSTERVVIPTIEARSQKRVGKDFGLCVNPEFLREGSALNDMMDADRIIIGEYDRKSGQVLLDLYGSFYEKSPPILRTNLVNAEFIKYASNAFLATKISFINTIANIAQRLPGGDVNIIAEGMGFDKRIGKSFLSSGLGYGGSCLPKDLRAFLSLARSVGYEAKLLSDIEYVNDSQVGLAIDEARKMIGGFDGKTVTVLGLSFKPDTDDLREAVSRRMIATLLEEGAHVNVYDPVVRSGLQIPSLDQARVVFAKSSIEALSGSDCCFLVTEWTEFKNLEPEDFVKHMRTPVLVDGRRLYDPAKFLGKMKGFSAVGLGSIQ